MATSTKLKYIDSRWPVFAVQGIIALLFGWFVMFTGNNDVKALVVVVGVTLLSLGMIEAFNLLHRAHTRSTLGLSLAIALFEVGVALSLLLSLDQNPAWHLTIVAVYTLVRGVFEILIGLRSIDDSTDRSIWVICGICGSIVGFAILNSGHFTNTTTFVKFFGSYMMIFGLCNLIYGVHNRDQGKVYLAEKSAAKLVKKSTQKSARKAKTARKK